MGKSLAEVELSYQLTCHKIPHVREYRFHKTRKWRFDFAFPDHKLAAEIEGGIFVHGRHQRPTGFIKDMEKYNAAVAAGWRVLRFTPKQVKTGEAVLEIMKTMGKNV